MRGGEEAANQLLRIKDNEQYMEKEFKRVNMKIQTVLDQSSELQLAFNDKQSALNEEEIQKNSNIIAEVQE